MPADFPNDDSLCEACGYPLKGIAPDAHCPECGDPAVHSDPAIKRTGLPIQFQFTPKNVLHAYRAIALQPKATFDRIRLDGGLANERLFLLLNCVLTAMLFEAVRATGWCAVPAWASAILAVNSLGMMAMEAWGVRHFARRRQWRVDWRLAQRVICLASVGWLVLGPLTALAIGAEQHGWLNQRWVTSIQSLLPNIEFFIGVLAYTLAILWFETIVGLGVRRVKYGNRRLQQQTGEYVSSGAVE